VSLSLLSLRLTFYIPILSVLLQLIAFIATLVHCPVQYFVACLLFICANFLTNK